MSENAKPIILIIDDDKDYLEILQLGLSNEFEILTIGNFHGLEKTLEGMRPSIILLDKNLGETQPKDVIATIRRFEPMKDVPILLMSGSDPGKRDLSAEELDGFMIKPASFQEVRDRLRSTLSRK